MKSGRRPSPIPHVSPVCSYSTVSIASDPTAAINDNQPRHPTTVRVVNFTHTHTSLLAGVRHLASPQEVAASCVDISVRSAAEGWHWGFLDYYVKV